jgi:hypothetical protein
MASGEVGVFEANPSGLFSKTASWGKSPHFSWAKKRGKIIEPNEPNEDFSASPL